MNDAEKKTLEGFIKAGRLNQGQLTAIRSLLAEVEEARCDEGCVPMAEYDRVLAENERLRGKPLDLLLREAWKLASGANKAALAAAGPPPHSAIVEAMIHALVGGRGVMCRETEWEGLSEASEVDALRARIEAALALHFKVHTGAWGDVCEACTEYGDYGEIVRWPCPTVKALKGGK